MVLEIVNFLRENWIAVPIVASLIFIVYLVFSIRLVFTARRAGMNVCMLAFIPGINLIIFVIKCIKRLLQKP